MSRAAEPDPDAPLFNTAAVVQRTGLHATTLRAWERRYGFPLPSRDASGQRLYSPRDIQAIRWLAEQTAAGVNISRAVDMLRGGYGPADPPDTPRTSARSFAAVRADLTAALFAFDARQAEAVLAEAFVLFSVEDVCQEVLVPMLVEVGERWHAGQLSVAEEHYVSNVVRTRLFALLLAYERAAPGGPLVFTGCAPEEWHEVGILIVSVFLARRGYAVRYLGPNLSLDGLSDVLGRIKPVVLVLSAQAPENARKLALIATHLSQTRPPRPRLAFGGQAFNDDVVLREAIAGTYVGPDAASAVRTIAQLIDDSAADPTRRRRRTGGAG